jgi:hypothetical protein
MNQPLLAASFSLICLCACEKHVHLETAHLDAVRRMQAAAKAEQRELTAKEVESVLGQPEEKRPFTFQAPPKPSADVPGSLWVYRQDGKEIVLRFVEGRLSNQVPQFGDPAPLPDASRTPAQP